MRGYGRHRRVRSQPRLLAYTGPDLTETECPANREGLSASAIKTAAEDSLRRLRTDHVDLFWTHMEDRSVSLEETGQALALLVESVAAARLGTSNHALWRVERARNIAQANGWPGYTALQLRHSYAQPAPRRTRAGPEPPLRLGDGRDPRLRRLTPRARAVKSAKAE
ncbi:aldo/keto reductase [Microbispora siamensis]